MRHHLPPPVGQPVTVSGVHLPGFRGGIDRILGRSPGECRKGRHAPTCARRPTIRSPRTPTIFDDEYVIGCAGFAPIMRPAERGGLSVLAAEHVTAADPHRANTPAKIASIVAGMVLGADSIGDLDLPRHCGMDTMLDGIRAPSTGTFLPGKSWIGVRRIDELNRRMLAAPAAHTPLLPGAGMAGRRQCRRASDKRDRRIQARWAPRDSGTIAEQPALAGRGGRPGAEARRRDPSELLADADEAGRSAVRAGFAAWESLLAGGVTRVPDSGELAADADPARLATGLTAELRVACFPPAPSATYGGWR
jgi:hypothetical protein